MVSPSNHRIRILQGLPKGFALTSVILLEIFIYEESVPVH